MARRRASMREGPLAELFRATEAAQRQAEGEQPQAEAAPAPATEPDERTVDHVPSWEEASVPAPAPVPPAPSPEPTSRAGGGTFNGPDPGAGKLCLRGTASPLSGGAKGCGPRRRCRRKRRAGKPAVECERRGRQLVVR